MKIKVIKFFALSGLKQFLEIFFGKSECKALSCFFHCCSQLWGTTEEHFYLAMVLGLYGFKNLKQDIHANRYGFTKFNVQTNIIYRQRVRLFKYFTFFTMVSLILCKGVIAVLTEQTLIYLFFIYLFIYLSAPYVLYKKSAVRNHQ